MRLSRRDLAVFDALLPRRPEQALTPGLAESGFDSFVDDFEQAAPAHLWRAFRLALFAAAWVAPLLLRRLPPITSLAARDREAALAAMSESKVPELRQLVAVLKTVASLHYGGLAEVRRALGYP